MVFWSCLQMHYDFQNDAFVSVPIENVQKEVEFILVMSTSDFVLSMFPFVSAAANMRGIKHLLSNEKSTARSPSASDVNADASVANNGPQTYSSELKRQSWRSTIARQDFDLRTTCYSIDDRVLP